MSIGYYMNKFAWLKSTDLRKHHDQRAVLAYIPVVGGKHVLGTLIENRIKPIPTYIKSHAVSARVQVHLVKVGVIIDIRYDAS